jgi:hypothetical protein
VDEHAGKDVFRWYIRFSRFMALKFTVPTQALSYKSSVIVLDGNLFPTDIKCAILIRARHCGFAVGWLEGRGWLSICHVRHVALWRLLGDGTFENGFWLCCGVCFSPAFDVTTSSALRARRRD